MKLSMIVAMDRKGVIGRANALPWRISSDLKHFKSVTMGKPIIMGRKTHESIGKVLPGRQNIIITRNPDYLAEGCVVCRSLEEALRQCAAEDEAVFIGGHDIFKAIIEQVDRIYLTQVHADVKGDTWFPVFDRTEWREIERQDFGADENDEYPYSFITLEKKQT